MKKFIALLCTLCMIATMVPFSAFAAGETTTWTSWDGSALIDNTAHKFAMAATIANPTVISDTALAGNSGPYMQFNTKTDVESKDEAMIYCSSIPVKPYVAFSLNVYGKALNSVYSRYDSSVKPWLARDIQGYLADGRWNNIFIVYNNSTKDSNVYINGELKQTNNFYTYLTDEKSLTVDTAAGTYNNGTDDKAVNMTGARFKFVRNSTTNLTWNIDDLNVFYSDSAITPASYATLTSDNAYISDNSILVKVGNTNADLVADGAKIMVNGVEANTACADDEVVVVTSTSYGNIYSASYTVTVDTVDYTYDFSSDHLGWTDEKKQTYKLDSKWNIANFDETTLANATAGLGGKTDDSYLLSVGTANEHNLYCTSNGYSTRYFAMSINAYGQCIRDVWSRLAISSNKLSLVAEGNSYGGHITNALVADQWNNIFFVFDSQTKITKTYVNGEYWKSANLYDSIETLDGTVDREAGTATLNGKDIDANYMNLKSDIRFLMLAIGNGSVYVDDLAMVYTDYEPTPVAYNDITSVTGGYISGDTIYLNEGSESVTVDAGDAVVMVGNDTTFEETTTAVSGNKVVVLTESVYGTFYKTYTVVAPVYGDYSSFDASAIKWSYADGVLRIYGTGAMPKLTDTTAADRPWIDYIGSITKVVVEEGITSIGDKSFMSSTANSKISEVDISETVTAINSYAFQNSSIKHLYIPDSVTTVGSSILHNNQVATEITLSANLSIAPSFSFNSQSNNTFSTINVAHLNSSQSAVSNAYNWAVNYKNNTNPDAVLNVTYTKINGYCADTDKVENAFQWVADSETSTLTVSENADVNGNGKMAEFTDQTPPWSDVLTKNWITKFVVAEGIDAVASNMLRSNSYSVDVTLPSTLTTAPSYTFNAPKIGTLYISEGANLTNKEIINDNGVVAKIVFPSTMTPTKEFIRDFTFGTRGNTAAKSITIVAPYASPAYNWAQERYAEAVAGASADSYVGMPAENITILESYKIDSVAEGKVTVTNNTGYAVDSAYVLVAYYDDAQLESLSAVKLSDVTTLADVTNTVTTETYADAADKTVVVYLWNNLDDLKPLAGILAQ